MKKLIERAKELTDILYLRKKLINNKNAKAIRFATIIGITSIVTIIHYILEKVIDVI